jgi:hypothetical protein
VTSGAGALRRAVDSSATVDVVRRVVAGSALCAGIRLAATRIGAFISTAPPVETPWTRAEAIRLREQRDALLGGSRLAGVFDRAATAGTAIWRHAQARHALQQFAGLTRTERCRAAAATVLIATLTHAALLAALGDPVHAVGWSVRAVLLAASLLVLWRPGVVAAAWTDKVEGAAERSANG